LGNAKFADLSGLLGNALSSPKASRGLALGDLDGDHRPEIVITNLNATPTVLRRTGARRNLLKLSLRGSRSNRSAFGARVTVTSGKLSLVQELASGGSYFSQHETALYFGLGASTVADRVEVRWPNGAKETWRNLDSTHPHELLEAAAPR
ncbi:MAG: ASPIC/UnbV domain-containing protein, partial [Acidobacteriota bacterium]